MACCTRVATIGTILCLAAGTICRAATFAVNTSNDTIDARVGDGRCLDASQACSLRAAIMEANALRGEDSITLPAVVIALGRAGSGEDRARLGDLDVLEPLEIIGAGKLSTTIDASRIGDRVFHVLAPGSLDLVGLAITGGSTSSYGGGVYNQAVGGITVRDVEISSNSASSGGGIYSSGGSMVVTASDFRANHAEYGAGVALYAGGLVAAKVGFHENEADRGGGLWVGWGSATLQDCVFERNRARHYGGAVSNTGNVHLQGSPSSVRAS